MVTDNSIKQLEGSLQPRVYAHALCLWAALTVSSGTLQTERSCFVSVSFYISRTQVVLLHGICSPLISVCSQILFLLNRNHAIIALLYLKCAFAWKTKIVSSQLLR